MIYFNGNTYKTLDQKFYLGNKQIGYVYKGETLIYPEKTQNIIKGIEIKGISLNLNVFDTGIAPTKDTVVEICFENKSSVGTEGFPVFGTHADAYYAVGGTDYKYNPKGDNVESELYGGTSTATGDWGNGKSGKTNNTYKYWKNKTSFHLILKQNSLYVRYGGEAVQGDGITVTGSSCYNGNYNTNNTDNIYNYTGSSSSSLWNSVTNKTDSNTGNSISGKFFTIIFGKNKKSTTQNGEWSLYKGIGENFYGSTNLCELIANNDTKVAYAGNSSENIPIYGGNLWIGSCNRNFSSSENAVSPNKMRGQYTVSAFERFKEYTGEEIKNRMNTESSDLHRELFKSGKLDWVYIIIKRVDDNGNLKKDNSNGKKFKYIFLPEETEISDPYNEDIKLVVFKKYGVKDDNENEWNFDNPLCVIVPFMHCIEYTN